MTGNLLLNNGRIPNGNRLVAVTYQFRDPEFPGGRTLVFPDIDISDL